MKIWSNRPLFMVTSVFLGAALGGFFLEGLAKQICFLIFASAALLLAGLLIFKKRIGRRIRTQQMLTAACLLAAAAIAMLQSYLSIDRPLASAKSYVGRDCVVLATVEECKGHGDQMSTYALDIHWINGESVSYDGLLTCYHVADLRPGYTVLLSPEVIPLSQACGGIYEEYLLVSEGRFAGFSSTEETDYTILSEEPEGIGMLLSRHRMMLSEKMALVFGKEAAGLPSALLLGERGQLTDQTKRDFARTGVSHILAISGLHMTLLFGLLALLLRLFRIPARVRAIILGISALAYLIYLGFPPSATRAVIMLGATYLSTLCFAGADPLTSLGLAGAVILLVSPTSVADIGFWMSFSSTLGLLTISQNTLMSSHGGGCPLKRRAAAIGRGLCAGIGAVTFSLWVVAPVMGELSLLSPIMTLVLTPLIALLLLLVPLAMLTLGTPLGEALIWLVQQLSDLITQLCASCAKPSWVVISLRHPLIPFLAIAMILLTLLLLGLTLRRKYTVFMPMAAGWLIIGLVLGIHHGTQVGNVNVSYLVPSTTSEMLVMTQGHEAVILELSNGSRHSLLTAADEAAQNGATEMAAVILTDYHTRTSGSIQMLMHRAVVRRLCLPRPTCEEDYYVMLACLEAAENTSTSVIIYDHGNPLTLFGDMNLTVERQMLDRSVQPVLLVTLETPSEKLTLCGRSIFESELASSALESIRESQTVIFSNKGPLMKAPMDCTLQSPTSSVYFANKEVAAYLSPSCYPREDLLSIIGQGRFRMTLQQ